MDEAANEPGVLRSCAEQRAHQPTTGDPRGLGDGSRNRRTPGGMDRTRLHIPGTGDSVSPGRTVSMPRRGPAEPLGDVPVNPNSTVAPMDRLTLPEPARTVWLRTRGLIKKALKQLDEQVEYRIGGDSILAARWGHRKSFDLDLQVEPGTRLDKLERPEFEWLHRELRVGRSSPVLATDASVHDQLRDTARRPSRANLGPQPRNQGRRTQHRDRRRDRDSPVERADPARKARAVAPRAGTGRLRHHKGKRTRSQGAVNCYKHSAPREPADDLPRVDRRLRSDSEQRARETPRRSADRAPQTRTTWAGRRRRHQ